MPEDIDIYKRYIVKFKNANPHLLGAFNFEKYRAVQNPVPPKCFRHHPEEARVCAKKRKDEAFCWNAKR